MIFLAQATTTAAPAASTMSPLWEAMITGIVSGIITAILIWVCQAFWSSVIAPRIHNFLYRDIRIDGRWRTIFHNTADNYTEEVELEQVGHHIEGTIRVMSGPDSGRVQKFSGEFRNMILTAMYSSSSRRELDRGSFTLRVARNGTMLTGISSYYREDTDTISQAPYEWQRTEAPNHALQRTGSAVTPAASTTSPTEPSSASSAGR